MQHERPTPESWFRDHYETAVDDILEFLAEDGLSLDGRLVADIGCGEGAIALGLAHRTRLERIVGYDLRPVDRDALDRVARAYGPSSGVPDNVEFCVSQSDTIPAASDTFDVIVSWSAFEHVTNPGPLLRDIRRVLNPAGGVLFLQAWPLFHSEHGGHLWLSDISDSFAHLTTHPDTISAALEGVAGTYPGFSAEEEWASLNRLTLDGLQRALLAARLVPVKVELITHRVHLNSDLMRYPLSDLMAGGVKLLAVPMDPKPIHAP